MCQDALNGSSRLRETHRASPLAHPTTFRGPSRRRGWAVWRARGTPNSYGAIYMGPASAIIVTFFSSVTRQKGSGDMPMMLTVVVPLSSHTRREVAVELQLASRPHDLFEFLVVCRSLPALNILGKPVLFCFSRGCVVIFATSEVILFSRRIPFS